MAKDSTPDDGATLGSLYELLLEVRDTAQEAVNAYENDEPVRAIARFAGSAHFAAGKAHDQLVAIASTLNG